MWMYKFKISHELLYFFVMNLAERTEDIDYEPDVMKLGQIWKQMKETSQPNHKDTSKAPLRQPQSSKNKTKTTKNKESNTKQTLISKKNIQRNPKQDHQAVIQVVTNPQGYHVDDLRNQKNNMNPQTLLQTATNAYPIGQIHELKRKIEEKDYELSLLRVSNSRNQDRALTLEQQLSRKEEKILELQARERELLSQISKFGDRQMVFDYGRVEYENFKNDSRRLLKMLQTTSQYQQFANLALEDDGVRFLHSVNQKIKTHLDQPKRVVLHFCTCNKDFIPESGFWLPEKVYSFGKQFLRERKGELTQPQLELLLYELNKIWREREKRIINTLNSQKAKQVEKLKRKIGNLKKQH